MFSPALTCADSPLTQAHKFRLISVCDDSWQRVSFAALHNSDVSLFFIACRQLQGGSKKFFIFQIFYDVQKIIFPAA